MVYTAYLDFQTLLCFFWFAQKYSQQPQDNIFHQQKHKSDNHLKDVNWRPDSHLGITDDYNSKVLHAFLEEKEILDRSILDIH